MEYSRTKKYEKLRNKMQNEVEDDIRTGDLSAYEERLNRIDPKSFDAPYDTGKQRDYDPVHARGNTVQMRPYDNDESVFEKPKPRSRERIDLNDISLMNGNANDTGVMDSSYISEYLREVKDYNVQQGNAYTQDTSMNVLKSLRGDMKRPQRPYNDPDPQGTAAHKERREMEAVSAIRPMGPIGPAEQPKEKERKQNTVDIPFFENEELDSYPPLDDYIPVEQEEKEPAPMPTGTMSKADIAAEVQQLISSQDSLELPSFTGTQPIVHEPTASEIQMTREQLLNETTQMRAQLDDYEENLSDMSVKVEQTNSLLNFVLIVVIIALAAGLCIVLYWILIAKGIL